MGISTSPSLWIGDKGGHYYIRTVGNMIWWLGFLKNGRLINMFSGNRFGTTASGNWTDLIAAQGTTLRSGKLTISVSVKAIEVTYQTGGFPDRTLTPSPVKPIQFPKFTSG